MLNFKEVLGMIKGNQGLKVLTEGTNYATVENEEGYRAYIEADYFGTDPDISNHYRGYSLSTVHKPNKQTGSGWQVFVEAPIDNEQTLLTLLGETLERTKKNIASGRESKDTRQPKNGYLSY